MIEYTREAAGQTVECPRCKEPSVLPEPPADEVPLPNREAQPARSCPICGSGMPPQEEVCPACAARRRRKWNVLWSTIAAFSLVFAGWQILKAFNWRPPPPRPAAPTNTVLAPPPGRGAGSMNDLRVGRFHLEQRHGSNLMVAVGDITNISTHLLGRVTVDVDVLDVRGAKIGTVSSFVKELPGQSVWHFVAAVPYTNAASVRFPGTIREDK